MKNLTVTNQVPTNYEFETDFLKVIALNLFNGESFFFYEDKAFLGDSEEALNRYNSLTLAEQGFFMDFLNETYQVIEGNECTDETETDGKHIVLTDEEADEKAAEYIKDSLWAFNAGFIIQHSKLPYEAEEMIQAYQEKECESANDTIEALIEDMDTFIKDAIGADGRGHFMSSYDGQENEVKVLDTTFFIYRIN